MFNLAGFMRPTAIAQTLADLAPRFATEAFTHSRRHNICFRKEVPGLSPDHPALALFDTTNHTLCAGQIARSITDLCAWPAFGGFLAATRDKPPLYPMDDPLSGANAMASRADEGLNWHVDRSEFTTTLLLQAPAQGGAFAYRSDLRSAEHPDYDGVARLLQGRDPGRPALSATPGTLNVFRGSNTVHRVTPVLGATDGIICVFSCYDRPGIRVSPEQQRGSYGRVA